MTKLKFTVLSLTPFVNLVQFAFCLELINATEVFNELHEVLDYIFSPLYYRLSLF